MRMTHSEHDARIERAAEASATSAALRTKGIFELTATTMVVPIMSTKVITVETPVAAIISTVVNARRSIAVRSYVTPRRPETVDPNAVRIVVAIRPVISWSRV